MPATPKIFHFVWVGDESKEPKALIASWKKHNPDAEIRVYRNDDLFNGEWHFKDHMLRYFKEGHFCGVADLIRWEVLYKYGGIALDADSLCLRALPDWFFDCELVSCWDNTQIEGELISNGFVLVPPKSDIIKSVMDKIDNDGVKFWRWSWSRMKRIRVGAWRTVGPVPYTDVILSLGDKKNRMHRATILPSHFFLPERSDGVRYTGNGPVYAHQFWGSTTKKEDLNDEHISAIEKKYRQG